MYPQRERTPKERKRQTLKVKTKVTSQIFKVAENPTKINQTKQAKKEPKTKRQKESSSFNKTFWKENRNLETLKTKQR